MLFTHVRRELTRRRRQTVILATGVAAAIGLVIVVDAASEGVREAQSSVLQSMYGVGTDVTVSERAEPESGSGMRFEIPGAATGDTGELRQVRLGLPRGTGTVPASLVDDIARLDSVAGVGGGLTLNNTTLSGTLPPAGERTDRRSAGPGAGALDIDSFTVSGVDPSAEMVGLLSGVTVEAGRLLDERDHGSHVAVLDSSYALSAGIGIGESVTVENVPFEVVGTVASATAEATTASDVYVPLDVAQTLAGLEDRLSTIYVQARSAAGIEELEAELAALSPTATVQTQAELAGDVTGSLGAASDLVSGLGTWLTAIALATAFVLSMLSAVTGVTRRTREFGTLKAIGWSNQRIAAHVGVESLVHGLLGGALGALAGLGGVLVVNATAPVLTAAPPRPARPVGAGLPGLADTGTEVILQAPVTPLMVLAAVSLATVGGVLSAAIGGWRAAALRPAAALRSVE
ncbi:ABC transporter permease [Microbacterium sp. NPDC058345]|uniref:ABC transporter permease n=1 Tax=Microbacterium sp. NPDC058345 TaxID=3346455 RepID=UPI003667C3B3